MNPRELVDHIRSGPVVLMLYKPIRFRRRTRSNPCDFNEFLQALRSSETIRLADCLSPRSLEITEDEWVLLVKTIGSIRNIRILKLYCAHDSRDFRPFQAVAEAVNNAPSLSKLEIGLDGETVPRDPAGLTALANALKEHTALQTFNWVDYCSRMEAAPVDLSPDPVLRALPACPHLREVLIKTSCDITGAIKNLLQLGPATELRLVLETDQSFAVADAIRQGHCNIKHLCLDMFLSSSSEAIKAIASAIRLDRNLESLRLLTMNDFTHEAGVALAEALTVNKTLHKISLSLEPAFGGQVQDADEMSAPTYEAFSTMLRINTSLILELPPFKATGVDERLVNSRNQMRIEQGLNHVGREDY
jgi:hypothetical protein